jgi:hypothetical protein
LQPGKSQTAARLSDSNKIPVKTTCWPPDAPVTDKAEPYQASRSNPEFFPVIMSLFSHHIASNQYAHREAMTWFSPAGSAGERFFMSAPVRVRLRFIMFFISMAKSP